MKSTARWDLASYLIKHFELSGWAAYAVIGGSILLCMIIPYLLGSLNFGLIISRAKYHDDIRTHGSGNAGTTNMLRTYGKGAAILTLVGDMAKAALAVGLGYLLINMQLPVYDAHKTFVGYTDEKLGAAIAGLFVMLGHIFPCFYRFKGGKGVATAAMVVLMINPLAFAILLAIFIVIVACTRYVSLGSVMSICLCPIILSAFEQPAGSYAVGGTTVVMAIFVVYMHRENLKRLKAGKESKISFKKKDPAAPVAEETPVGNKKQRQKQKYQEEQARRVADAEAQDKYEYVTCAGCGSLIPKSRKVCAYCHTSNAQYAPDEEEDGTKNRKKRSK